MNDLLTGLVRLVLRLIVVATGVVVFLSVLAAAAVLALVWGARALWARLTGRPVTPWAMRMDPRAGWSSVYRGAAQQEESHSVPRGARGGMLRPATDVTDVQPRDVR